MKISKQARREAKQLFRSCSVSGLLDEARARTAVASVLRLKPRGYLAVLTQFQRLVKLDLARRTASVHSATPLSTAAEAQVRTTLTSRYGAGLNFQFQVNPSLVGGLKVQVGSDVFDGSVLARLNALADGF